MSKIFFKNVALLCGAFCCITGFLFLICWHLQLYDLIKLPIEYTAIPYPSTVCIFLIGLAICTLFANNRFPVANIIGIPIFLIAFDRILNFTFSSDFGLSHLYPENILPVRFSELQMSGIGAFAFSLIGLLLIFWRRELRVTWASVLSLLISSMIVTVGLIGVISYFLPLHLTYIEFESALPINGFCSFLIVMLGIGLIAAGNYFDAISGLNVSNFLPILTTVCLGIISILISLGIEIEEEAPLKDASKLEASRLKSRIESEFQSQITPLKLLSYIVESSKSYQLTSVENAMTQIFTDIPLLQQITTTDSSFSFVDTLTKKERSSKSQLFSLSENKKSLIQKKNYIVAISIGKDLLAVIFPLYWDEGFKGALTFSFPLKEYFEKLLQSELKDNFSAVIYFENKEIVRINEGKNEPQHASFNLGQASFQFDLIPTAKLKKIYVQDNVPVLVLSGSILISICFGLLIYLLQSATDQIAVIESYKSKLLEMQEQQRLILSGAKIGLWSWDLKEDKITWDDYNFKLFGVSPQNFTGKYQEFIKKVVHEDQDLVTLNVQQSLQTGRDFKCNFRIYGTEGMIKSVYSEGKIYHDEQHRPIKMAGINWELTSTDDSELDHKIKSLSTHGLSEAIPKKFQD